jgi:hypothetical protein
MEIKMFKRLASKLNRTVWLWRACRVYQQGAREAERKHAKDKHRYYCVYDPGQGHLVAITYEMHKGRGDSYKYLVQRGRWKNRLSVEEMKQCCFYYTPSKWTRRRMTPAEAEEKKREFLRYYLKIHQGVTAFPIKKKKSHDKKE